MGEDGGPSVSKSSCLLLGLGTVGGRVMADGTELLSRSECPDMKTPPALFSGPTPSPRSPDPVRRDKACTES